MELWLKILYQSIGIVALIICVLSFQIKKNKIFLILQCLSCFLFAVQFFIGKAWAAFIMNSICIMRSLVFAYSKKLKYRITFGIILSLLLIGAGLISIFYFKEIWWIACLCSFASVVGTISIISNNEKIIRYFQLGIVSPCWIINNIFYFSIGGIVGESFNMISALIALIRWKYSKSK